MADKVFAELSIRGIKNGHVFGPIETEVAGLTPAEYDNLTGTLVNALFKLGVDVRDQVAPSPPTKRP